MANYPPHFPLYKPCATFCAVLFVLTFLCVLFMFGATGVYAQSLVEMEPNDSIEQANDLPSDTAVAGVVNPGNNRDYYKMVVTKPGRLTVYTTGSVDTGGLLLNSEGEAVVNTFGDERGFDDAGRGFNFRIEYDTQPDTYYIAVR